MAASEILVRQPINVTPAQSCGIHVNNTVVDPMTTHPSKRKIRGWQNETRLSIPTNLRRRWGANKFGILTLLVFMVVLNMKEANATLFDHGGLERNGQRDDNSLSHDLEKGARRNEEDPFFPVIAPSQQPTASPTVTPTDSLPPSPVPTATPSIRPTTAHPTDIPSAIPSFVPSTLPSLSPSLKPTSLPSISPSTMPSTKPSLSPSEIPSSHPSTHQPSLIPSVSPTQVPSLLPSAGPSDEPSSNPTSEPTLTPSKLPSLAPSSLPSASPTGKPTTTPSLVPTGVPSVSPTALPSLRPSSTPTARPSSSPSVAPTSFPSLTPTLSSMPSRSPSAEPTLKPSASPSAEPSLLPSTSPSSEPSLEPSVSPSYQLQSFEFPMEVQFDKCDLLDETEKETMQTVTSSIIRTDLEERYSSLGKSLDISTSIYRQVKTDLPIQQPPPSNATSISNRAAYGPNGRRLQDVKGLRLYLRLKVELRSATDFKSKTLESAIGEIFDSTTDKYSYIFALQTAQPNSAFKTINSVDLTINNLAPIEIQDPIQNNSNVMSMWIIIGSSAGGFIFVVATGLCLFRRNRNNTRNSDTLYQPQRDQRVSTLINVTDPEDQDISTLGDPVYPGGVVGIFAANQSYQSEEGEESLVADYDYNQAYRGAGETPSISTAGGTKSAQGVSRRMDEGSDHSSRNRVSSASEVGTSVRGEISLFSDDNSFERMYGEEEQFEIIAPSGKLGVVIDTPYNGGNVPVVHAIKDTSVLADRVRIGDKLLSVDGQDTRNMSAIKVSKLISAKAMEPQRKLVFLRSGHE